MAASTVVESTTAVENTTAASRMATAVIITMVAGSPASVITPLLPDGVATVHAPEIGSDADACWLDRCGSARNRFL